MKEFGSGSGVSGPGEILSEFNAGLKIWILEGNITPVEAQELFNMKQRELNILALANPGFPWETGSTQVKELERRGKELQA